MKPKLLSCIVLKLRSKRPNCHVMLVVLSMNCSQCGGEASSRTGSLWGSRWSELLVTLEHGRLVVRSSWLHQLAAETGEPAKNNRSLASLEWEFGDVSSWRSRWHPTRASVIPLPVQLPLVLQAAVHEFARMPPHIEETIPLTVSGLPAWWRCVCHRPSSCCTPTRLRNGPSDRAWCTPPPPSPCTPYPAIQLRPIALILTCPGGNIASHEGWGLTYYHRALKTQTGRTPAAIFPHMWLVPTSWKVQMWHELSHCRVCVRGGAPHY